MNYPRTNIDARFWRMLRPRYQRQPLSGEGARRFGGRWNPRGIPALYMAADHATAVAEFHQNLVIPGTLVPYDVVAASIFDLTDGHGGVADPHVASAIRAPWLRIAEIEKGTPPSWALAEHLIEAGAEGALVPSARNLGGVNLVLWRWGRDAARVVPIDPTGELN